MSTTDTTDSNGSKWQLESVRTLDDFLFGSARFCMPNYQDLEKWNKRIIQNLLYYQTNYFILAAIIISAFAIFNFVQTFFIFFILFAILSIYLLCYSPVMHLSGDLQTYRRHIVLSSVGLGVFILYLMGAIATMLLMVLLPIFISFVHASFRMRNVNNKMSNLLYNRFRSTPMGIILNALDKMVIDEFVDK